MRSNRPPIGTIFRFFRKPDEADAFVRGEVWLSTLEWCRSNEECGRADPGEGRLDYHSGHVTSDDPNWQTVAARLGIGMPANAKDVTISHNTVERTLQDAWVLCTTERDAPDAMVDFGPHCVRIDSAPQFFKALCAELKKSIPWLDAVMGRVVYREPVYVGTANPPGPIGFVKSPDEYAQQQEIRMLWTRALPRFPVQRGLHQCTGVGRFLTRLR